MKKVLELLNALNKVETDTFQNKIIKQDGIAAMLNTINLAYPDFTITYRPGKGYVSGLKKYCTK